MKARTLAGFCELMPSEQIIFDEMKRRVEKVFIDSAFSPIDTPILEYSDVLLAKGGGETDKQVYRFTKGDTDMCMRFDQTVPLAKYVSMYHNDLAFPFRRYAIGKVFRGERAQKGRFREFYQCDLDIIGDGELSTLADSEILSVFCKLYEALGFDNYKVRINSRKILNAFFENIGVLDKKIDILRVIDKFYKMPENELKDFLLEVVCDKAISDKIFDFISLQNDNPFKLCETLKNLGYGENFNLAVCELEQILNDAIAFGAKEEHFEFDLKTVRGLDYYTGIVFECFITDHLDFGSCGAGGRYDNLTSCYSDKNMPGVGFGFGLTRLFAVMRESGMLQISEKTTAKVGIITFDQTTQNGIEICKTLRDNKIQTQLLYGPKNIKGKFNLANKLGVPFVIVVGEDEVANKKYVLKNMQSGEQEALTLDEIIKRINK